jgi:hypothetical protein
MNPDQLVSARDVLRAIEEVRRAGVDRLLPEWERREPDLAEHLLEGISELHRRLAAVATNARAERRLIRRTETLILVLLTAQRRALLRHWQDEESEPEDTPTPPTADPGRGDDAGRDGGEGGDRNA